MSVNISLGTYEQLLYGIDVKIDDLLTTTTTTSKKPTNDTKATSTATTSSSNSTAAKTLGAGVLRTTFALSAHLGSIRCCASNSKYLATGSTDETIKYMFLFCFVCLRNFLKTQKQKKEFLIW